MTVCIICRHGAQRGDGCFRPRFLYKAQDGIQHHDAEDGNRFVRKADSRSYNQSPAEIAVAISSRMTRTSVNCARNVRQAGTGVFRCQLIAAVAFESGFCLRVGEAVVSGPYLVRQ